MPILLTLRHAIDDSATPYDAMLHTLRRSIIAEFIIERCRHDAMPLPLLLPAPLYATLCRRRCHYFTLIYFSRFDYYAIAFRYYAAIFC